VTHEGSKERGGVFRGMKKSRGTGKKGFWPEVGGEGQTDPPEVSRLGKKPGAKKANLVDGVHEKERSTIT